MASMRILVVDDYQPFRRFICSTIEQRSGLQVVGEASDGLEAVQKSQDLQPDLIVLDLGLPKLNGIEAARQIRKCSAISRILIVSQESSPDIVHEAFSTGALGYVVKSNAGSELLPAVDSVLRGSQFVSACLLPSLKEAKGRGSFEHTEGTARTHEVQFYADDESLLVGWSRFIEAALLVGNAVIVAAAEGHQRGLREKLHEGGVDLSVAIDEGRYITLDIAETLSIFMVSGLPDPVRFKQATGRLLSAAAKAATGETARVAVCGECAPTLWVQGKMDAAIQLEHLWDEITKKYDVDVLCGYVLTNFQADHQNHLRQRICAEHSAVLSE
jgi:DNA-binding NarL/FixJ family response regulator